MRFKTAEPPKEFESGKYYWMKRFALFPKMIKGVIIWLEFYERREQLIRVDIISFM